MSTRFGLWIRVQKRTSACVWFGRKKRARRCRPAIRWCHFAGATRPTPSSKRDFFLRRVVVWRPTRRGDTAASCPARSRAPTPLSLSIRASIRERVLEAPAVAARHLSRHFCLAAASVLANHDRRITVNPVKTTRRRKIGHEKCRLSTRKSINLCGVRKSEREHQWPPRVLSLCLARASLHLVLSLLHFTFIFIDFCLDPINFFCDCRFEICSILGVLLVCVQRAGCNFFEWKTKSRIDAETGTRRRPLTSGHLARVFVHVFCLAHYFPTRFWKAPVTWSSPRYSTILNINPRWDPRTVNCARYRPTHKIRNLFDPTNGGVTIFPFSICFPFFLPLSLFVFYHVKLRRRDIFLADYNVDFIIGLLITYQSELDFLMYI